MRISLPVMVLAAACGALLLGAPAGAQTGTSAVPDPMNPTGAQSSLQPWERNLQRYYDRERMARQRGIDPLAGLRTTGLDRRRALLSRFYRDPARSLGLKANPTFRDSEAGAPPPLEFAPNISLLDVNGDGAVSRDEYFSRHQRFVPPGSAASARARRANQRLAAQFRTLDANKDGMVTPDETAPYPDARF